ncbi:MAG: hypothetical protein ACYS26_09500 [Planctomycetota bacterium]|jgi:hypothetical protein
MRSLAVPTLILPLLGSCATGGGFVSSLDDLTADVDVQGIIDLEQARSLSLNGLAPNDGAGGAVRFKASRSPFTAIGISNADFTGDSEPESYIERRTIGADIQLAELVPLRDGLLDVRLKASELIRAIASESAAKARQAEAQEDDSDQAADLRSAAKLEVQTAAAQVESTRKDFNEAYDAVSKQIDRAGIMIVRVAEQKRSTWAASLGELLGFSSDRKLESTGFAVLGGVSYELLYVGSDVAELVGSTNRVWKLIGDDFPFVLGLYDLWGLLPWDIFPIPGQVAYDDVWVVTSALRAKHVLYAQDQLTQDRIEANLEASYNELSNLDDTLEGLDKVRVEAVFESLSSLGNTGITGVAQREIVSLEDYLGSVRALESQPDGTTEEVWQVVYQVGSDLSDLRKFVGKNGVRFDLGLLDWFEMFSN